MSLWLGEAWDKRWGWGLRLGEKGLWKRRGGWNACARKKLPASSGVNSVIDHSQ